MLKIWQTPKWKKKRGEYIKGKKCEWCGSDKYLSIAHKKHFNGLKEYKKIGLIFLNNYFKDGRNEQEKQELTKVAEEINIPQYLEACPKCKSSSVYERKTIVPKFRCQSCGYETDELIRRLNAKTVDSQNRKFLSLFFKKHREEVNQLFSKRKDESWRDYLDFKEVWVLCRRCHFAQGKGMILCKKCGKKYQKPRYKMCRECFN